ncbi:MAG: DUF1579 family protein [Phycisphaerae bacterium]|jgi:hypothetical protein|nr:DUF1579 family protein [Phycisphaerae bacterium]
MKLKSISSIAFLTSISLFATAQIDDEVPGEMLARMQQLGEELATPTSQHDFLAQMAGEWSTSTSVLDMDPSIGSASYTMIFGNRFLDGMHNGSVTNIPFEGRLTIGFDTYKHKFTASFIDNLGTSMRSAEGLLDKTGKVLSLWGTMDEWMTDEHDKPVLYRYAILDKDHFTFEVHDLSVVSSTLVIKVSYERISH